MLSPGEKSFIGVKEHGTRDLFFRESLGPSLGLNIRKS